MAEALVEPWFDTRNGELLEEPDVVTQRLAQVGTAIRPLGELLLAEEFEYGIDSFEKRDVESWEPEKYQEFGGKIMEIVRAYNNGTATLDSRILYRLYILGIGPEYRRFKRRGITLETLAAENDQPLRISPKGHFDTWTVDDFSDYGFRLKTRLGHNPTRDELRDAGMENLNNPTLKVIISRFGKIRNFHEHLGRINSHEMDEFDDVEIGVRIVRANGEDMLNRDTITILSGRKQSPGYRTILRRSGGWGRYREDVLEKFYEWQIQRTAKLYRYKKMIADAELPNEFELLDEATLLKCAAQYELLDAFKTTKVWIDKKKARLAAYDNTQKYISAILASDPGLRIGDIELEAELHDMFEDIWPNDEAINRLIVTPLEIQKYKEKESNKMATYRANKKSRSKAA